MLSLFESVALESLCNFRIALAVRLAAHREVHAHFGTFSSEIIMERLHNLSILHLAVAEFVLAGELFTCLHYLYELVALGMAKGTLCGRVFAFVHVSAYETSEFLLHDYVIS